MRARQPVNKKGVIRAFQNCHPNTMKQKKLSTKPSQRQLDPTQLPNVPESSAKCLIYQVFTRLFGNQNTTRKADGSYEENGCGKMNHFDAKTLRSIRQMGFTHIWYTGIIRHATTTDYTTHGIPAQHPQVVKGRAGSPYAIADYYDVDPDLAVDVDQRMHEFEALVDRTHQAGMKVIIDFVPNHVAREYHSICKPDEVHDLGQDDDVNMHFSTSNNFYYCWGQPLDLSLVSSADEKSVADYEEQPAKATGNDHFDNRPGRNDWYETVKLNYGIDYCDAGGRSEHFSPIPNTWGKMTDILLFWAKKGVDGFRCDMAEMVPAAFWTWATDKVKFCYPHVVFIGEVYNLQLYRTYLQAGFDYLYDKVGMYDCVRDVICGRRPACDITQQWQSTDDIRDHMLYFLENHDEQRVASDFFAGDARKGVPGVMACAWMRTNPFMCYAGQELGERGMDAEGFSGCDGRTTIFDYWSLDTLVHGYFDRRRMTASEKSLMQTYQRIFHIAHSEAVSQGAFYDLMYVNPHMAARQYAFLRKSAHELLLIVVNFGADAASCGVVIPRHAFDYLQVSEGEVTATDLLHGDEQKLLMLADTPVPVTVSPYDARVYRIEL